MGILKPAALCIILLFCAGLLLHGPAARAQDSSSQLEKKVKAGLIYNFLKYTAWPENAGGQSDGFKLCLLGPNPFSGALKPLEGRTAQNKTIAILRVETIEEGRKCHLLFIHSNLDNGLPGFLERIKGYPVLLVSDMEGFADRGGMVELATENGYINIHVNRDALRESGLVIQDRLLKLAKKH